MGEGQERGRVKIGENFYLSEFDMNHLIYTRTRMNCSLLEFGLNKPFYSVATHNSRNQNPVQYSDKVFLNANIVDAIYFAQLQLA